MSVIRAGVVWMLDDICIVGYYNRMTPMPYAIEQELLSPTPRRTRIVPGPRSGRTFMYCCLLLMLAIVAYGGKKSVDKMQTLEEHGKTAHGILTAKYVSHGRRTAYDIHYKFTVNGEPYTGTDAISESRYDALEVGNPLIVTYLPENPLIHYGDRVTSDTVNNAIIVAVGFTLAFTGIIAIIICFGEGRARNSIRLLRDGVPVQAVVMNKTTSAGRSTTHHFLTCEYYAGSQAHTNRCLVPGTFYRSVEIGGTVTMLYLQDKPATAMPYRAITDAALA
jgi:hypothetical protein